MSNNIPKITTRETEHLRSFYPSLSYLEAGRVAEWLQERKDQLLEQAQSAEAEGDTARLLGLVAAGVGTVCYAINPFMLVGGMVGGAAWLWFVADHYNRTKEIAPLPWVRGNFLDAIARAGDFEYRQNYNANHLADTIKFLPRRDAQEYVFLYSDYFETVIDYLTSVEPGKRFYAYRWLLGCFEKFSGRSLPDKQSLDDHLENVAIDSRVKVDEVTAIQEAISTPKFVSLPKPPTQRLAFSKEQLTLEPAPEENKDVFSKSSTSQQQSSISTFASAPNFDSLLAMPLAMPLQQRAEVVTNALIKSGFKIDEVMSSQVVAIAGTQRGGKGTLAAILATLSLAYDPKLNVQYFTAGVDVYPVACNLHSALRYPNKSADVADENVARDLLLFLKGLEGSEPYSHKNLILVIDEAMRLLSLVEESDRVWAIQFLLSRFAKTGAVLIIVLHGSNLSSVVGAKNTNGLADTFKQSVSFIGCVAKPVDAGGLRKMNVASGEYFKANPDNFGTAIANGSLGAIPEWLKTSKHPGNGQPDPARTLLTFFPELVKPIDSDKPASDSDRNPSFPQLDTKEQLERLFKLETTEGEHTALAETFQPDSEMTKPAEINNVGNQPEHFTKRFTRFNFARNEAIEEINRLRNEMKMNQTNIIKTLWGAKPGDNDAYRNAVSEFRELMGDRDTNNQ